jgi:hypothetical protein
MFPGVDDISVISHHVQFLVAVVVEMKSQNFFLEP